MGIDSILEMSDQVEWNGWRTRGCHTIDLEHAAGDIRCEIFNRAYEVGCFGCNPVE